MKKYIFIIILLLFLSYNHKPIYAFETSLNKEMLWSIYDQDDLQIIDVKNDLIICLYQVEEEFKIELRQANLSKLILEEKYQAHLFNRQILYLATNKFLYKIDLSNFKYEQLMLPSPIVKQITYYQDCFWFVGSVDKDGSIVKLNMHMNKVNSYLFGGDGYECFDYLFWINETPIVLGQKSAHSYHSPFSHVGNKGEIKSFVVKFNNLFAIEDAIYFNHLASEEIISQAVSNNRYINFYLTANDDIYYYQIDQFLQCKRHIKIRVNGLTNLRGFFGHGDNFIHVMNTKTGIYWQVEGEEWDEEKKITEHGKLIFSKIEQGVLSTYVLNEQQLWVYSIHEHHVERLEPFIVSRADKDVEGLSNILVSSYFEDLKISIKDIKPYFSKLVSGTYDITYLIERLDGSSFTLESQIIVPDYANVMNKGVYKTGHQLMFFGKATLNGENILNNHQLKEPGFYQLILTNCFGKKTTVNFEVVDNYYQKNVSDLIPADYYLSPNEKVTVAIPLHSEDEVTGVVVNNDFYFDYQIEDDKLLVTFGAQKKPSLDSYEIEKIICTNNIIVVNQLINVRTLKKAPAIEVSEQNQKHLTLKLNISDPDQSIICIETALYLNDQLIKVTSIPMHDSDIFFNVNNQQKHRIITKVLYELGDGTVQEIKLVDHHVTFSNNVVDYLKVDISSNNNQINSAELAFNTASHLIKHHEIKVFEKNVEKKYQVTKDLTLLTLNLCLTGIIVITFGVIILKKRKKTQVPK